MVQVSVTPPNRSRRRCPDRPRPGSCRRAANVASRRCTTKYHNAHVTKEREVIYPWHPWFGRVVFVHQVVGHGDGPTFRCSLTEVPTGRCLEVPAWMFDRALCLQLRAGVPQVDGATLVRLKILLADTVGRASPASSVIGARHPCHDGRGDAHATPRAPAAPDRPVRSVPAIPPGARSGGLAPGGAREGRAPDGAPAGRTPDREARR